MTNVIARSIELDHGTGAKLSQALVAEIAEILSDVYVGVMEDSAILPVTSKTIAMTTDSFVVDPILFGNGDIGKIAVCGTVNDLAVSGAVPKYLSLALILETGLDFDILRTVLESVAQTAHEAGVTIVCGDTKVVRKGEADGIYINTTGVGEFHREPLRMTAVRPGDVVILTGPIGGHTVHLLSIREGLGFEQRVLSDCAPLNEMLGDLMSRHPESVHSMRDVTRGGLNAVLNEYADTLSISVEVSEGDIPIQPETLMAADMLGINPLNCANEGCAAIFASAEDAPEIVKTLHRHKYGKGAKIIGSIRTPSGNEEPGFYLNAANGDRSRILPLQGAELPRLC